MSPIPAAVRAIYEVVNGLMITVIPRSLHNDGLTQSLTESHSYEPTRGSGPVSCTVQLAIKSR